MTTGINSSREMYQARKAAGQCVRCGVPVPVGTRCRKHAAAANARTRRAQERNRAGGRCRCGRESDGAYSICAACRTSNSTLQRNRYAERRAAGRCVDCGGVMDRDGARCATCCRIRQAEKIARRG